MGENNRDPENVVFSTIGKEHTKPIYNDAAFLLSMAAANRALFSYKTLNSVRRLEIPSGKNELILRFRSPP